MIREKLYSYYKDRGLEIVDLHTSEMELFYKSEGTSASLVWIVSDNMTQSMDKEAFNRYYNKIRDTFFSRGFNFVNVMTLFLTNECKKAAEIAEGTPFWVVDEKYGRLVIYENQPEDYLGMRRSIEGFLSFMTRDRQQQAEQYNREAENIIRQQQYQREMASKAQMRKVRIIRSLPAKKPYAVVSFMLINVIILLIVNLFGTVIGTENWSNDGAASWMAVIDNKEYYRLITCMFLHGGIDHIAGNLIVLFAAGEILERAIGHINFTIVYMCGGIIASGGSVYYNYVNHNYVQSIGASGAVFAVVGALVIYMFTHKEEARYIGATRVLIFAVYALYSGFINEGTDNAAHVAGVLGGGLIYLIIYTIQNAVNNSKVSK